MGLRRSFKATNIVTNGDFSKGTTGWTADAGVTISALNNELTILSSIQYGTAKENISVINGHKYYFSALVKSDGINVSVRLNDGVGATVVYHDGSNVYKLLTGIHASVATSSNARVFIQDNRASGWTNIYLRYVMVTDLTNILPPDILSLSDANLKAWCDLNIPVWFDGTINRIGRGGLR